MRRFCATSLGRSEMFKRLIGVLPVRDGRVVKSYGYRMWRPAGRLKTALLNLDRWAADEVFVLDISGRASIDPGVLSDLRAASVSTPITYGGGMRSVRDATAALRAGADRILIQTLLWSNPGEVSRMADAIGRQAIVVSLPVSGSSDGQLRVFRRQSGGRSDSLASLDERLAAIGSSPVEELLVTDVDAEGARGEFSLDLARRVAPLAAAIRKPVIWFGGIDVSSADVLLGMRESAGVAFANVLLERELALREVRESLNSGITSPARRVESRHD